MSEILEQEPQSAFLENQRDAWISEDWLAVWIGLLIFALGAAGLFGHDLLGWAVTTSVWTSFDKALGTASKTIVASVA